MIHPGANHPSQIIQRHWHNMAAKDQGMKGAAVKAKANAYIKATLY